MLERLKAKFLGQPAPSEGEADASPPPAAKAKKIPGWIGVDLDGTLAEYGTWKGIEHIGKPIPLMVKRIQDWTEAGYTVKIMTARASVPEGTKPVERWLEKQGLPALEVTNQKDFEMLELWDDRAIQVVTNTGNPVLRLNHLARPKAPLLKEERGGDTCEVVK